MRDADFPSLPVSELAIRIGGVMRSIAAKVGVSAVGCVLATGVAIAGQRVSFDGVQYVSGKLESVTLESGHTYTIVKEWRGIHVATDSSAMTHRTRVECTGYIDARADGTFTADGYCNHWDKSGDLWVGHWWNGSQLPAGRFEVVAGSGKYAGATGGGTASCSFLKAGADPQAVCEIKGEIQLK